MAMCTTVCCWRELVGICQVPHTQEGPSSVCVYMCVCVCVCVCVCQSKGLHLSSTVHHEKFPLPHNNNNTIMQLS